MLRRRNAGKSSGDDARDTKLVTCVDTYGDFFPWSAHACMRSIGSASRMKEPLAELKRIRNDKESLTVPLKVCKGH